ncbi:bifunctional 2-C-methyl-D-erythritol 4-phosphate cytidylyltransferase/2-C-methyl-D-erythritol 2,4-cyclodiphosphate synthase [Rhodovulum sp. 12E13]|uniref:bifunctional 2-C-methyl-D-erythritol 4-phosphate cytidylyltransferase/2-C-methyl-D-erythritol 2,4-cyclodiphosphate synthase n=1 Tax=Rhodovulum sp. 12E13 TaxID=2203891 RepID=UPI000E16AFE5|nr:bifunctional 2-C-methyl-D-erythritol 4-phosphate cytidylyltransferase/2-C-methyl-D-erythritol 2,4-cyclodiphosphate synthase [Rhodovulum sp. 12E13]RDC73086.1 bifunctional 2-C-methyl-D-erythritol 4-phosphate cytidylyltransferase/2-C-methyl-D-erythritol 2,4-cyclodiphosphate synthase [Rhodovulum sp. 12E13]
MPTTRSAPDTSTPETSATETSAPEPAAPRRVGVVVVAAGRGTRMGGEVPKQYQDLGGLPVLARTVAALADHPAVAEIVVVIHPDDAARARAALPPGVPSVAGGATRAASVAAGLAALPAPVTHVLIHDAARPFVTRALIGRVLAALERAPGAAPALPVTDALWREGDGGTVAGTAPRDGLWRAQTPQGFRLDAIRTAHASAPPGAADDVEVAHAAGLDVAIVPGEEDNIKLTRPEDWTRAARILADQEGDAGHMEIRLGNGYDVHRFGAGTAVILCGVEVPHDRGLQGHSDADVGMHAITDAIYGALAQGDIGRHFPPSDPQWKGAASDIFLRHAVGLAVQSGFRIGNVDCTLVCERPKIGPHANAMQTRLAEIMGLEPGRVSVKATTSERLGFTGREEGIAALATVALVGRAACA